MLQLTIVAGFWKTDFNRGCVWTIDKFLVINVLQIWHFLECFKVNAFGRDSFQTPIKSHRWWKIDQLINRRVKMHKKILLIYANSFLECFCKIFRYIFNGKRQLLTRMTHWGLIAIHCWKKCSNHPSICKIIKL